MSRCKLACAAALSLAFAGAAFAEDGAAPAAAEPAAPTKDASAAPTADAAAADAGAAPAAPPAEMAPAAAPAEAADATTAPSEATASDAAATNGAADVPAAQATDEHAAKTEPRMPLGPVGHDAQGRAGRIHIVRRGDTLWDISDAYLGTPWVWPSLWKDNDAIRNPHWIYPGDRIWISPYEIRKVTEAEAAALLAPGGEASANTAPAALAEADAMPPTKSRGVYRFPDIDTAGFVTREQYEGAASILDSPEPTKWITQPNEVVIGLGHGEVQVGDQFDVFRTQARVTDLDTGTHFGWATNRLGWIEVTRVDEESARAIVRVSRSEMQRGDRILPRRVRSPEIPIGASPGPVEGRIVHTPDRRLDMAQADIVYLDRGAKDGLAIGSPLEVYRALGEHGKKLDAAQNKVRRLADHVVAKLLVVDVYDDTSVAVVTHTTEELNRGDSFRGSDSIQP